MNESLAEATTQRHAGQMPPIEPGGSKALVTAGRRLLSNSYLVIILILVGLIGMGVSPFFLTGRNLQNVLVTGSVVAVLAVGQFVVIVTAGIDLSVGSIAALATVIAALLLRSGQSAGVAVVVTIAACAVVGLVNGALVVFAGITPFIATLGTMTAFIGFAYIIQNGILIGISDTTFIDLFSGSTFGISHLVVIFVVVMGVTAFVMQYTPLGRQLYAIGGNAEASRLSGLPVKRDLIIAYAYNGLLAGLAGLMLAAQLGQGSSLVAKGYELDAIAAAVVGGASLFGGTGSPITSVVGAFIIGTITNIMNLAGIQAQPQLVIQGSVILIAVYLTSGGGPRDMRRLSRWFKGLRSSPTERSVSP